MCMKHFHLACGNVAKESLAIFKEARLSNCGFIWRCMKCRENILSIEKSIDIRKELNELKQTLTNRINELENLIGTKADNQQKDILTYANAVKGITKDANTTETTKVLKSIDERITDMSTNISVINDSEKETALITQKSKNLCIFNIPESEDTEIETKYKHDVSIVQKIIGYKEEIQNDIVRIVRRGVRTSEQARPRPVILTFSTIETRQKVLQMRDVKHTNEDNTIIPIYISPDRTRKQQEEHRQLVLQLKKRKADGETNIGIRNGRIVALQPFRRNPQLYWGEEN